jgi:hypothetical protein
VNLLQHRTTARVPGKAELAPRPAARALKDEVLEVGIVHVTLWQPNVLISLQKCSITFKKRCYTANHCLI